LHFKRIALGNWVQLIQPGSKHLTSILETENMRAKISVFTPQDALVGLHPMAGIEYSLERDVPWSGS
jgi:hypothetical protein